MQKGEPGTDESGPDATVLVKNIPISNRWILLLYAAMDHPDWARMMITPSGRLESEDAPDEVVILIGEYLCWVVEKRLRRMLSLAYQPREAVLNRVRGRIDILATERGQLLQRGLVACRFDALTMDSPRNRFVCGALTRLAGRLLRPSAPDLAGRCRKLADRMRMLGVGDQAPSLREISGERTGLKDAEDRLMLAAAKLVYDLTLPTERVGNRCLPHIDGEGIVEKFWQIYEAAIRGYFRFGHEKKGWRLLKERGLRWQLGDKTAGIDNWLPGMEADIILENDREQRRIVVDAKSYGIFGQNAYGKDRFHSNNLYQIYAYVRSQEGKKGIKFADSAEGVLIHPRVMSSDVFSEDVNEAVAIQGHIFRFMTVNLAESHEKFMTDLDRILAPAPL